MRRPLLLALILLAYPSAELLAIDLAKIERSSVKLPELRSGSVQYCLLVFGPDAANRVWLAHDGDRLYVDRNGNGDLTEPGETVVADAKISNPAEGVFRFKAGDIAIPTGVHKDLNVGWGNINHMKDLDSHIKARLDRDATYRGCSMWLDVATPGYHGKGIGGRVTRMTSISDRNGLLEFASRLEDAPVVDFGGPWEVTLSGQEAWHAGRKQEVYLVVGTPGLGPGTTACVAYENVIPAGMKPVLDITWPAAAGATPRIDKFVLARRCCTVNLYGDVTVPCDVPTGVATVKVSLESWPGTTVASTKHEVRILPALPGLKRAPVSSRLLAKLEHQNPNGLTVAIHFSPDGKRLIAGDYPGGLVHVWDMASGRRLKSFDMGEGNRSSHQYFVVAPDWKTIIAPTNLRGNFDRVERDGKTLYRVSHDDSSIRVWDLESGRLLNNWKTDPPRSTRSIALWPDKRSVFAYEEIPGEFESPHHSAVSTWDLATGERKELIAGNGMIDAFSPDGKQAVVTIPATDNAQFDAALAFYNVATWEPTGTSIQLRKLQRCHSVHWLDAHALLAGVVYTNPTEGDFANATAEIKLWNLADGSESWSLPLPRGETLNNVQPTFDQSALYLTTRINDESCGRLLRLDLPSHELRVILDDRKLSPSGCYLHPGGKWMIVPVHEFPKSAGNGDVPIDELPQPHLQVRDVVTGALLEDLVAPPAYMNSIAFSPDSNTLATSGEGAVLLWDFADPPAAAAPAVVGQPFAATGTLVDGKPLDWSAYRGKVVLVTYWATWCQPCVAEIPDIKQIYDALHQQGFDVLAVSLDKDQAVLKRFLDSEKIPWQVVCAAKDDELGLNHPLARKYGVETVPKSFLIDRQGRIAAIDARGEELSQLTKKLLGSNAEKSPAP